MSIDEHLNLPAIENRIHSKSMQINSKQGQTREISIQPISMGFVVLWGGHEEQWLNHVDIPKLVERFVQVTNHRIHLKVALFVPKTIKKRFIEYAKCHECLDDSFFEPKTGADASTEQNIFLSESSHWGVIKYARRSVPFFQLVESQLYLFVFFISTRWFQSFRRCRFNWRVLFENWILFSKYQSL